MLSDFRMRLFDVFGTPVTLSYMGRRFPFNAHLFLWWGSNTCVDLLVPWYAAANAWMKWGRPCLPYFFTIGYRDCDSGGRVHQWAFDWAAHGWGNRWGLAAMFARHEGRGDGEVYNQHAPLAWWRARRESMRADRLRRKATDRLALDADKRAGTCGCGGEVWLDRFTNTCPACGTDYDRRGHRLAPRAFWGEDTGESIEEILSIP